MTVKCNKRIRRARTQRKLTQAALALEVGVHRSAVAQWEQHEGTTPGVVHLGRIADALHVSFEWLATGRGRMKIDAAHEPRERIPKEFALDEMEESILFASRHLGERHKTAVLALMESLAK